MVNIIDRVIGSKVERRTLADFDYNAPAPKKHMRDALISMRHGDPKTYGLKRTKPSVQKKHI